MEYDLIQKATVKLPKNLIHARWLEKYFIISTKESRSISCTKGGRKKANCLIIIAGYIPPALEKFYEQEVIKEIIEVIEESSVEAISNGIF